MSHRSNGTQTIPQPQWLRKAVTSQLLSHSLVCRFPELQDHWHQVAGWLASAVLVFLLVSEGQLPGGHVSWGAPNSREFTPLHTGPLMPLLRSSSVTSLRPSNSCGQTPHQQSGRTLHLPQSQFRRITILQRQEGVRPMFHLTERTRGEQ
jgi:hypothetical protein